MEESAAPFPARLVLYDGVCAFCNRTVQVLLKADRAGRLRFAPLQGSTAAELRRRHPEIPQSLDSLLYVVTTNGDERVYSRSQAIFRICADLEVRSPLVSFLRWFPLGCTDLGYRLFARIRYRLFGKLDTCPLPSPAERDRFLP